ncbi:hypothetical protein [Streptomyces sp. 5-6(2022)]|uniref:hypothetical protein n=1 Tax=Streptomyces sp. 5-6(2022) TaxID=2936510 RepID=UPI0023BA3A7F|nr:hypothetical protein [Streptomyces sp. 5-6(2022)]
MRPNLPLDPTAAQHEAWVELVSLLRDDDFRLAVRSFFHDAFSGARSYEVTAPSMLERIERLRRVQLEAMAARRSGLPADGAGARDIARRVVASMADVVGQEYTGELRRRIATTVPDGTGATAGFAGGFTGVLGRYHELIATINETPLLESADLAAHQAWLATAATAGTRCDTE